MLRIARIYVLLVCLLVTSAADIPEVTSSQLLRWHDDDHDYYFVISKTATHLEDSWIESSLSYLSGRPVGLAMMDCSNDITETCLMLQKHSVLLFKKGQEGDPQPLQSRPVSENDFVRSLLELLAVGLHHKGLCETNDEVEAIAGSDGALVALVADIESPEYLTYLNHLLDIKEKLRGSLITLYSSEAIPPKKVPRRSAPLHIWYVVSIGDQPQWLPMGHSKKNDMLTDIMNFVTPLGYPVIHEYQPNTTPEIYKNAEIDIVYVLMKPEHRETDAMKTVLSLARRYVGHFSFIIADFDRYGLKVSDVQLPDHLEDNPYTIIKPKNYDQLVHASPADVPFEFDLLSGLLTSVANERFKDGNRVEDTEIDIPLSDELITFDRLRSFRELLVSTGHYVLAGFCIQRSSGCNKISQLLSPIATVASNLHNNLAVAIIECSTADRLPGGLLTKHLPSVALYNYTDKTWTEYRQKKTLDGIHGFLLDVLEVNPVVDDVVADPDDEDEQQRRKREFVDEIIAEFASVSEDDPMGKLANKLGPADLTTIPQLTDVSIGPFVKEHNIAVVTFYQKWCVQSKVFLHHVISLKKLVTSEVGVAVVSCSDWPDVCDIYNITTYPRVLIIRSTQVIQYTGHTTAHGIVSSLPYYTAPVIQQLTASSLREFISNCSENKLLSVLGIFPETSSASYQTFVATASRYHGRRLFGVLETATIPDGLPVEVATLPAVLLVGGATPRLVTDLDKLDYALLAANELTPETLPFYLSINKPIMVFVAFSSNTLVEAATNLYDLVTWLDYIKYGGIVERYMSTCHQPPALLVLDFSVGSVYHCSKCSDDLSPTEMEKFIHQFTDGKLKPTAHFEAKEWKPVEKPFKFPSSDEMMDDTFDYEHSDSEDEGFYENKFVEEHANPPHTEL